MGAMRSAALNKALNGLLKKSDNVHVDLDPDSFSGSLVELMIMPRNGHQAA